MSNPNPVHKFAVGNTASRTEVRRGKDTLSRGFLKAMCADFEEHGEQSIKDLREKDVATYCKLAASFVPKELEVIGPFDGLDSETIARLVAGLDAILTREIGAGTPEPLGSEQTSGLQTLQ